MLNASRKYSNDKVLEVLNLHKQGVDKLQIQKQTNIPYGTFSRWVAWYNWLSGNSKKLPSTFPKSARHKRDLEQLFGASRPAAPATSKRQKDIAEALVAVSSSPITDVTLARKCANFIKLKNDFEKAKRELYSYLGGI